MSEELSGNRDKVQELMRTDEPVGERGGNEKKAIGRIVENRRVVNLLFYQE